MKITCFLPCRKGSERVPKKNIRPFSNYSYGLIEIKLNQLSQVDNIDNIVLSTNDEEVIKFAESTKIKNLHIHHRDDTLSSNNTSTDELITHAGNLIDEGHILWTHVTSPFLNTVAYKKIIDSYIEGIEQGYDSLMTTTLIRSFVWNDSGPINYDREKEKWPRTQTLNPLHEVNSAVFLCSVAYYKELGDRIGKNPKLYPLNNIEGFDIDWQEDFIIAQSLLNAGLVEV